MKSYGPRGTSQAQATTSVSLKEAALGVRPAKEEILEIPVNLIRPMRGQPRTRFEPEELDELGESLQKEGQKVACSVRRVIGDPKYCFELIGGERRYRAAIKKGIKTLTCVVKAPRDRGEQYLDALIDNEQRVPLDCLDEAQSYRKLISEYGMTPATIAARIKKTEYYVACRLMLLKLHKRLRDLLVSPTPLANRLSPAAGVELARLVADAQWDAHLEALANGGSIEAYKAAVQKRLENVELRAPGAKPFERRQRNVYREAMGRYLSAARVLTRSAGDDYAALQRGSEPGQNRLGEIGSVLTQLQGIVADMQVKLAAAMTAEPTNPQATPGAKK